MVGLVNLGNTCGVNTLLQCIFHVPALRQAVLQSHYPPDSFAAMFRQALEGMDIGEAAPLRLEALVERLAAFSAGLFPKGRPHDVCELWMWCADCLHEDGAHKVKGRTVPTGNELATRVQEALHTYHQGKQSPWLEVTGGSQIVLVRCARCEFSMTRIEPTTVMTVELPVGSGKVPEAHGEGGGVPEGVEELSDWISRLFEKEAVPDWKCDRCHQVGGGERMVRTWELPRVLVVVLKRFDARMRKKNTPVKVATTLSFCPPAVLSCKESVLEYDLQAVACHHGTMHGGHYTAVVARPGQGEATYWAHMDDEMETPLDIAAWMEELHQNTVGYVLFYTQRLASRAT